MTHVTLPGGTNDHASRFDFMATITARPQHATRARPDRPNDLDAVAGTAEWLGMPLRQWQRDVVAVVTERIPDPDDPDGPDIYAYDDVVLSVGRRAGKTVLLFVLAMHRLRTHPGASVRFTAQNGASARITFRQEWAAIVDRIDPDRNVFKLRLGNGTEAIELNGGYLTVFSPTKTALHGTQADLVFVDEAFAHTAEAGRDIITAAKPTTYTVPDSQCWYISAAGDLSSTWLAELLDQGRRAALLDRGEGLAHFEWTADGTELDTTDPVTWQLVHPGEIPTRVLRSAYERDPEDFARTILNITNRSGSAGSPFDIAAWRRSELTGPLPAREGTLALGVDVDTNQTVAAIVAAFDGGRFVEVIDMRPGTDWVVERVVALFDAYDVERIAVDSRGPAGAILTELVAHGLPLIKPAVSEAAGAVAAFASLISTGQLRHAPDVSLDIAIEGARRRLIGDGGWTVSRRNSASSVTPLIAAALAVSVHPDTYGESTATIA